MKTAKKILCVFLSILMCSSLLVTVFAEEIKEEKEPQKLVLFVEGINSKNILEVGTDKKIFPPETSDIIDAVKKVLPAATEAFFKQDISILEQPLADAVNEVVLPGVCDENGKPSDNTYLDWEENSDENILETYHSDDPHMRLTYCYDWRLSMQDIVVGLHNYIERIMRVTGVEKVSLVGFSMGTCVVMSYIQAYKDEVPDTIESVVLLAGAYAGVSSCGEPFSGKLDLDSDALVRFMDGMFGGEDIMDIAVTTIMHKLNANGIMDGVIEFGEKLIEELKPVVYKEVFAKTFAMMPGMWSLIAPEDYEDAKAILGDSLSQGYIDIIDWYHYEVQAKNEELINYLLDNNINFGIVVKYGYADTPVIEDINVLSDSVIDTKYESFGATCADVDEVLSDEYIASHDAKYISPDRMIDASTCKFPDYTWFIKNISHSEHYDAAMDVCRTIINADHQISVWDVAPAAKEGEVQEVRYPQFNIYDEELDKIVPLTEENNKTVYTVDPSTETNWSVFVTFVKRMCNLIKKTCESMREKFKALFRK